MNARSNSAAEIDALLERAREHIAKGDEHYRLAREAILEAKKLALPRKLSNRDVAKAIGRSPNWVDKLLREDWVATDGGTPFAGSRDPWQDLRRALRELSPGDAAKEVLQYPEVTRLIGLSAQASAPVSEPESAEPSSRKAVNRPVLQPHDIVKMGPHLLVVGDATHADTKWRLLKHAGWPYRREFFYPDADDEQGAGDGEMDVVVVTDPPYGQSKREIANDDRADWSAVYRLFQPRGGFAFCAFAPPYFHRSERGIIDAGGVPVEYLLLDKTRGQWWRDENNVPRVRNVLEAIIYFERRGETPWIAGRRATALLPLDLSPEAERERKAMAGGHSTPKPIGLMKGLIERVSQPGDVVFDPFTGSGSTLIACERTGRRFFGVELKPKWAERAAQNWMEETGQDALVHRKDVKWPISLRTLIEGPASRAAAEAHAAYAASRRRPAQPAR